VSKTDFYAFPSEKILTNLTIGHKKSGFCDFEN